MRVPSQITTSAEQSSKMHFFCLPEEVIEIIFSYNDISFEDIINFRCVCKQFSQAARSEYFLKEKYLQRWPIAKEHYDKNFKKNEKNEKQLNFIKIGLNCTRQLQHVMSQIINGNYFNIVNDMYDYKTDVNYTDFNFVYYLLKDLKEIINEIDDYIILIFFMDEIKNLLTQSQRKTNCDLTKRYYYILLYKYLRSYLWQKNFDKVQEYYHKEHLLERTAAVVANWFQSDKNVLYSSIKASLDTIALEVLNCLKEVNPNHSIFSTTDEMFTLWKNNNIEDNYWDEIEGTQIMDTLNKYIFYDKFKLKCGDENDDVYTRIDYTLENKEGEEINILIIYQSVARRLGLRCEIIETPEEPLQLFWIPKYTDDLKNIRPFTIIAYDAINYKLLNFQRLYHSSIVYSKIIRKQAYILEPKQVLETLQSFPNVMQSFYTHQYILKELRRLTTTCELRQEARPQKVKFAVGMIVRHKGYTGVIIGWHQYSREHFCHNCLFCLRLLDYRLPMLELEFDYRFRTENIGQTTLYIILSETYLIHYVKEDDITLTTPKFIDEWIDGVGHYFCKFEKTHYVPNKILEKIYPQDAAIAARTVFKN